MIETWDIEIFAKNKPESDFYLISGSFDPPHLGHVDLINNALNKFPKAWIAISPHNLSETKNLSKVPLEIRRNWLRETIRNNFPNDLKRIVLNVNQDCSGPSTSKTRQKFIKILEIKNIIRLRGDENSEFNAPYEIIPRGEYSSTIIREYFKNNNPQKASPLLTKNVFEDIIKEGYYK